MQRLFEMRPLVKTAILGLLLLPFIILMDDYSPSVDKIPEGYSSSILAFEFASNQSELKEVLAPLSQNEIRDMDRLNYVDFGFMIVYGLFLFAFTSRLSDVTRSSILKKLRYAVPIAVVADALENIQLLKLTTAFQSNTELEGVLNLLAIFTWFKWSLLAIVLAVIGYELIKMKIWSKVAGYLLLLPAALCVGSLIYHNRMVEDLFGSSVFLGFLIIFIYAFLYKDNSQRISESTLAKVK